MQHGHGHGRTHTYITGDVSTGHGHGDEHVYVTASTTQKQAVSVSWDHHNDTPETWSEEYRAWAKERPHGAAVSQAQEHVRRHHPTMEMELGSVEDATSSMQSMLRRNGHPAHDEGFVMRHPQDSWRQSQAFTSDGQPGVALHPNRWDYGTLAHEVAHHLHEHELGYKPRDDETAHGPDFVRHYQNVLKDFGKGAPETLGEKYQEALGRIRAQSSFLPTKRLFGPTYGLDHRLFDENGQLKPDVRRYILETLGDWWKPTYGVNWDEWAKVYFAGSEASEWTSETLEGNGDFDVLIGIDYDAFRANACKCHPAGTDQEITDELNANLRKLDERTANAMIMVDGELTGPWDNTWYVNQDSWDIRKIKPYSAYDVSDDRWAVKPPHLPSWDISQFPEGEALVEEARAVASYVEAILKLPEPYRTQQGYALWQHLHSDRGRAFTGQGEGWYDPANVIEKWLDQQGLWEKLVEIMVKVKNDPTTRNAPANWSNDPHSSS